MVNMAKYKIKFEIVQPVKLNESFEVDTIKFKRFEDKNIAEMIIEAKNIMDAQEKALAKIAKVSSALGMATNQVVEYFMFDIKELYGGSENRYGNSSIPASLVVQTQINKDSIKETQRLYRLASCNEKLKSIIFLVNTSDYPSWSTLYKIFELINSEINIKDNGWASNRKIRSFKHTANSPEEVGVVSSRHGYSNNKPPSNPMRLNDAITFIEDLIQKWIQTLEKE